MSLLDVAASIAGAVADKLDASKQIERAGQRLAVAGVAAGIAAIGAVFITLAAFMALRNVVNPEIAALICGVGLALIAVLVVVIGRAMLRRQEAIREAEEKAARSERLTQAARQVGEIAATVARDNAVALLAAAFAFGLVKGLGRGRDKDTDES
jgi:heme exporter protein D